MKKKKKQQLQYKDLTKSKKRKKDNPIVEWFRDVAILIKNNLKITIIIAVIIVLVAAAVIVSSVMAKKKAQEAEQAQIETVVNEGYVITDEPLEVDAYPAINELMRKYYDASASGDVAAIESIKTPVDETEKTIITKKAEYVESYPTVTCYTKKGPVEGSFLVFAYYEVKLFDYESLAPGLNAWYVCQKEDGTYYINDADQDAKLADYCKVICVQDDVVDLNNTVNVKFNEVVANDAELASFLELLPELLTASVGEELAKANSPEEQDVGDENGTEGTGDTENAGEGSDEGENAEGNTGDGEIREATTTDVVNIRSSDSETADKVGKAQKGDKFQVLEQKVNGWSKIMYEGKECFIKSEYLKFPGEETESNDTASTQTDEITDEEAAANSPSSGTAKARDTINIREKDTTTADRVTVAYKGEEMTVIEKQTNGWTKVKFNGKTGYVKSEYLE